MEDKRIKHKELIKLYAQKMNCTEANAEKYLSGLIDTLFSLIKQRLGVTITHFGNFYISKRRDSTVFKFNPSQKLKAILGWSSTYEGD